MNPTLKIAKICSESAYTRLQEWIVSKMKRDRPEYEKTGYYTKCPQKRWEVKRTKTKYYEKLMTNMFSEILSDMGYMLEVPQDSGIPVDLRKTYTNVVGQKVTVGRIIYRSNKDVIPGEGDIRVSQGNRFESKVIFYIEIKAPGDTWKPNQKEFKEFCVQNGIGYYIVKTVDEFFEIIDSITT